MTQKIEFLPQPAPGQAQAAKARECLAARWRPEQALALRLAQTLPELRKRKTEPTELPQREPVWARLENPLMRKRARRTAKQQEQPGH